MSSSEVNVPSQDSGSSTSLFGSETGIIDGAPSRPLNTERASEPPLRSASPLSSTPIAGHVPVFSRSLSVVNNLSPINSSRKRSTPIYTCDNLQEVPNLHRDVEDSENSDFLERPNKRNKRVIKSEDWNLFKPIRPNSLYNHLLNSKVNLESLTKKCIELCLSNESKGFFKVLQLIVDACGYQNFKISSKLDVNSENVSKITEYMEHNIPEVQANTGKYLFKLNSEWANQSIKLICDFLSLLTYNFYTKNIILKCTTTQRIYKLLYSFCLSENRAIRHTANIIITKIFKTMLEISQEINKQLKSYSSYSSSKNLQDINNCHIQKNWWEKTFIVFLTTLCKNCCLEDPRLFNMRLEILEELKIWLNINPDLLCFEQCKVFNKIVYLLSASEAEIRLRSINICLNLVESNKYFNQLNSTINEFSTAVSLKIRDIDYEIAKIAIQICNKLVLFYPECITSSLLNNIIEQIYCENFSLANAAGKFLITYVSCEATMEPNKIIAILKKLIEIHSTSEYKNYTALFVEAIFQHYLVLRDFKLLSELLLQDDTFSRDEVVSLVEIMNISFYLIVKKKLKVKRVAQTPVELGISYIEDATVVLKYIKRLLIKYENEDKCIEWFIDILLLIPYKNQYVSRYSNNIAEIIYQLVIIFVKTNEENQLNKIFKYFTYLAEENDAFNVKRGIDCLKEKLNLNNIIKAVTEKHINQQDLTLELRNLAKYNGVFEHHNLIGIIDSGLLFNDELFLINNDLFSKYVLQFRLTYIFWKIKAMNGNNHISIDDDLQIINNFKQLCFQFLSSSNNFIQNEAFHCLIQFHFKGCDIIAEHLMENSELKSLLFNPFNEKESLEFMNIALSTLFQDKSKSLNERRQILENVLRLIQMDILSSMELLKIFKFYASKYHIYGDILQSVLENFRSIGPIAIAILIVQTLTYCIRYNLVKGLDSYIEYAYIKNLAKHFQLFVSKNKSECKLILNVAIDAAIQIDDYLLLTYVEGFTTYLNRNDKQEILKHLKSVLPQEHVSDKSVGNLIKFLSSKNQVNVKSTNKQSSLQRSLLESDTSDESEYAIEEDFSDDNDLVPSEENTIIEID